MLSPPPKHYNGIILGTLKMAARLSMNFAAGADWQWFALITYSGAAGKTWTHRRQRHKITLIFKNGALMLSPLRCCGRLLTLSVCLSGNSQAQIKKGH